MSTMPQLVTLLREWKSCTVGVLAEALGRPIEAVAADLGGLHDFGYCTRYGSKPESLVTWHSPDDAYVLEMLELAGDPTPWVDADGARHEEQLAPAVIDAMGPAVFDPRPLSQGSCLRNEDSR